MNKQSAFAEAYTTLLAIAIRINADDSTPSSPSILHEAALKVARKYVSSDYKQKQIVGDMDERMHTCQSAWRLLPGLDDNLYTQSEMDRTIAILFALLEEQANARQCTVGVESVYYIINCFWDMIMLDLDRDRVYLCGKMHFEVTQCAEEEDNPFSDTNTEGSVNPCV